MAGPNTPYTNLDDSQVIKQSFEESNDALRVRQIAGNLVTEKYDYIALTYVPSGNGVGEIQTVTYKTGGSGGTTVATLTLAYNGDNKLSSVTRS